MGSDRTGSVSDTARAADVAIDSIEQIDAVGERVVQIRRDERGVVVTVAALSAGPFDGETEVRVNADGTIRSIERLR